MTQRFYTKIFIFPREPRVLLEDRGVRHLEVHQQVTAGAVDVTTAALEILSSGQYTIHSHKETDEFGETTSDGMNNMIL